MRLVTMIAPPLFALGASTAHAQDDSLCRNGLFPTEPPFALARIGGTGRATFHGDTDGCPWQGEACTTGAYLVPGDTVIINRTFDGYVCAFFPSKGGGSAGWLESRRVQLLPNPASPPLARWAGTWSREGNPEVTITARGDTLKVTGQAFWPGPEPSEQYPSVHTGEISGAMVPSGRRAHYEDGDGCSVDFTLLGDFLVAGDNGRCGGANVSFSAVYRRMAR